MARKKRFAPNDNNLAIAYYRFSSHSQNEASIDQQRDLAPNGRMRTASKSCRSMRTRQYPAPRTHDRGSSRCCRKSQKSVPIPSSCGRPTVWDATSTFWRWRRRKSATRDARFTCWPSTSRRRDPKASSSRD